MAKYVCPACKKILIRSADDIRLSGSTSYCEETDKSVKLTRLKLGKPQSKRPAFDSDIADRWLARRPSEGTEEVVSPSKQ
jgi:hypothetical protein